MKPLQVAPGDAMVTGRRSRVDHLAPSARGDLRGSALQDITRWEALNVPI